MYNILGYLVFAMPTGMPFIAYHEPRGGRPPGPPHKQGGGGRSPPPQPPLAMRAYQACELLAKTHGVGFVDGTCLWGRCGGNATMGYIKNNASQLGYTL